MDRFNRLFQKSSENTTCQLYKVMSRLVRLHASNLLKPEVTTSAGEDLSKINLHSSCQLSDENLGIGDDTWASIGVLEVEHDSKPFFTAIRTSNNSKGAQKEKNSYGDSLLKDFEIINPESVNTYSFPTVLSLAKRFPQIVWSESSKLDKLWEEFMDIKLSLVDHPPIQQYKSADKSMRPQAGLFWWELSKLQTHDGQLRFPYLTKLTSGLLCIPVSNADSERGFSVLRKIHMDQRPSLNQESLIALMTIKFNNSNCCYDNSLDDELLTKCKKATSLAVHKYLFFMLPIQ